MVSLAQTYTDDDLSDWVVWDTWLELRENGDLVLIADTSVVGDSGFSGFSYQANAKVILDEASISGTIRWLKTSSVIPKNPPHFIITANTSLPPSGLVANWNIESTGVESALINADTTYYYIPYTIKGALIGKAITVFVEILENTFDISPAGVSLVAVQISGPSVIQLTSSHRHEKNVDFEIQEYKIYLKGKRLIHLEPKK